MMYSPSAVHLLHQLGIPLEWVTARHLKEHPKAAHLETARARALAHACGGSRVAQIEGRHGAGWSGAPYRVGLQMCGTANDDH